LIEHPQKANSPSSHCQKTKASTQKSSNPPSTPYGNFV
jgi:hypothetical protein